MARLDTEFRYDMVVFDVGGTLNAALLTGLADLTKRPPLLNMSRDQVKTMKVGFVFDRSKAERELGITYTPVRVALEEAIASYRIGG